MAVWQIIDPDTYFPVGDQWDDGLTAKPGDWNFTTERIIAHANGQPFNYVGTPNWVYTPNPNDPPPPEEEGE